MNSHTNQESAFSRLRVMLWPIESSEYKKFLPMTIMMFCILLNFSTLRSVKDGFVLAHIGSEAISFLKMYIVLPSSIIAVIVYMKLCNIMSSRNVFYTITSFFVGYITIFTFVLYPNPELVHPDPEFIEGLATQFPNFKWFFRILGKWSYATFYTIAELWGGMMINLLFWQFANQITPTEQAKRFYPMFPFLGNFGLIATGGFIGYFLGEGASEVDLKLTPILIVTIISGCMILLSYRWINNHVLTDPRHYDPDNAGTPNKKKSKVKLSIMESIKFIMSSKYIGLITIMVLSYGMSINLVEGVWKDRIKKLYVTQDEITKFMGNFQMMQGALTIVITIIGSNILRRCSWAFSASLTPLMILVTGLGFFGFIFFNDPINALLSTFMAVQPLYLAVMFGTIQNLLSKATKYTLFDSTKEMAYIPLDQELKTKGKAAVDVIGGRMAKSGGAVVQSTVFILFPNIGFNEAFPFFAAIFFGIVIAWLYATRALAVQYQKITSEQEKDA